MSHRNARVFLLGFFAGVALVSFYDLGVSFGILFVVLAPLMAVASPTGEMLFSRSAVVIFCVGLGLGMARFSYGARGDAVVAASPRALEGVFPARVVSEPELRDTGIRFFVLLEQEKARALVLANRYPSVSVGDRIVVSGVRRVPENWNSEFDWVSYLAKDGTAYEFLYPSVRVIEHPGGFSISNSLFAARRAFLSALRRAIPEPAAALAGGLVVGASDSLGAELSEKFRRVGLTHIVVLSGYNVSIVADAIIRAFGFMAGSGTVASATALGAGAVGIVLFGIMTGGGATVVRASVMALIALLARASGRVYEATAALFLAGFLMVLENPRVLVFDLSFQLSFLATLGLIFIAPAFAKRLSFVTERGGLRGIAAATLGAQTAVLPLLLYRMGELSLVSLPANLLVLPAIPATMLAAFLTGAAGIVHGALAVPFGYGAYAFLAYELFVVDMFSRIPFASVPFRLSASAMVTTYGIIGIWIVSRKELRS